MPVSADTVRKEQWGRNFDWEIKFHQKDAPAKFTNWFPAVEVDFGMADIEWQSFDTAGGTIEIPKSVSQTQMRITFVDIYTGELRKFVKDWMDKVAKFGTGVKPLDEACKKISVYTLSPEPDPNNKGLRKVISEIENYYISPKGTFNDGNTQESIAKIFSMDFKIVGRSIFNGSV